MLWFIASTNGWKSETTKPVSICSYFGNVSMLQPNINITKNSNIPVKSEPETRILNSQ
jgi:hypothetical protein